MPYQVVSVTHKFGIISQAHKRELQKRLFQHKKELEEQERLKKEKSEKTVLNVTEEFVARYNECSEEDRPALDELCGKMFEKIKRKLNLTANVDDITLQIAWAELSQLIQCNSPAQEESMDLFIVSLENSRLSSHHIATLFFLAETVLYWLRMDTVNQPYLRALEIKLLKVGHLVFQRIYYHFIEGVLDDKNELKDHLAVYLDGFEQSETVYSTYPDALLYMRYITAVGNMILKPIREKSSTNESLPVLVQTETDNEIIYNIQKKSVKTTTLDTTYLETISNPSDSVKVHDLSPTLWHSVDLFVSVNEKNIAALIQDSAISLIECSIRLNEEHWVDCLHALYIIGECAKMNVRSLDALLSIAEGRLPDIYNKSSFSAFSHSVAEPDDASVSSVKIAKHNSYSGIKSWAWELGCIYVDILTDICISGRKSEIRKKALLGSNRNADEALRRKLNNNNLTSYGLLDLTKFFTSLSTSDDDWGWKIRYNTIKGLVRICKTLKGDKEHEELRNICWSSLVVCQETEVNIGVLEALKVGQVGIKSEELAINPKLVNTKNKPTTTTTFIINNIHRQMARQMGDIFISSINDSNNSIRRYTSSSKYSKDAPKSIKSKTTKQTKKSALTSRKTIRTAATAPEDEDYYYVNKGNKPRTTLRDEIDIRANFDQVLPDFQVRKKFDLMRIVEDQYRKEIQKQYEENVEEEQ